MFAIVTCPECRNDRMIDLSSGSTSCPFCGKRFDTDRLNIKFKHPDQNVVRDVLFGSKDVPTADDSGNPMKGLSYKVSHASDPGMKMVYIADGLSEIYGEFTVDMSDGAAVDHDVAAHAFITAADARRVFTTFGSERTVACDNERGTGGTGLNAGIVHIVAAHHVVALEDDCRVALAGDARPLSVAFVFGDDGRVADRHGGASGDDDMSVGATRAGERLPVLQCNGARLRRERHDVSREGERREGRACRGRREHCNHQVLHRRFHGWSSLAHQGNMVM